MSGGSETERLSGVRRAAASVAAVAVVFTTMTGVLMAVEFARAGFGKPPWSGEIETLQARYDKGDNSGEVRETLRRLDVELRESYFRQRSYYRRGAWLLAAGAAVSALCFRLIRDTAPIQPRVPLRGGAAAGASSVDARLSRLALFAVIVALVAAMTLSWGAGARAAAPPSLPLEAGPSDK